MKFWDTSAVVPLLVTEARTPAVFERLRADPVGTYSWLTPTELTSALARREREGSLTPDLTADLERRAERLLSSWAQIELSDRVRKTARRLLHAYPLRSADALQLASAIAVSLEADTVEFMTLDDRLSDAAWREGLLLPLG
ncbi:MAG: type II toxin-antitoxin system VapC family toxin [Myxococcales bacterium]|nr:type II toxin-antitoxin system VapC family toxin [Myxococcales bacterium]